MSYLILIRRVARGLPAILCAAALACDGPTEPTLGEGPQMEPVPAPPVIYQPEQAVTIANPDGSVIRPGK